jgi:hypothetical protein
MCNKFKNGGFLNRFVNKSFSLGTALIIIAVISFLLTILFKVSDGQGLDYYISGKGYKLNYLGVLILLAVLPLFGLVAWLLRWYQQRHERDFEEKYTKKRNQTHDK